MTNVESARLAPTTVDPPEVEPALGPQGQIIDMDLGFIDIYLSRESHDAVRQTQDLAAALRAGRPTSSSKLGGRERVSEALEQAIAQGRPAVVIVSPPSIDMGPGLRNQAATHVARLAQPFEASTGKAKRVAVVGVGGAGVAAQNRMVGAGLQGVTFVAIDTDAASLERSAADVRMQIGTEMTRRRGSGANPDLGRAAMMEDYDRVKSLLKGADMVFITAGEGGSTGTGAAPIVARIARELGALTVGIVTTPSGFEGAGRMLGADIGAAALRKEVDTLITVPNNRLLSVLDKQTSMVEAFRVADDVLRQGVQGISDLITLPGLINLDFADVRTIMSEAGNAFLGIGMGTGDKRALEAAQAATSSPLLETTLSGARGILLSITGGRDLSLWEVNEAVRAVQEAAHPDANIILGAMLDETLRGDVLRVTVIAFPNREGTSGRSRRASERTSAAPGDEPSATPPRGGT
jgi:cell division protein FtsZ